MRREIIGDCELYLGDCLEILPTLGKVDAVVTDPPYGIADAWKVSDKTNNKHGWKKAHQDGALRNSWDGKPPSQDVFNIILGISKTAIIWGGNHFNLPVSRGWLVWVKPERGFTLSEAELAWTNRDTVMRVYECLRSDLGREHPTQKPLRLMKWCLGHIKKAETILDPFMGSGTTGVACVNLQRKFIGIEIEPKYFDIACKRIEAAYKQRHLFPAEELCEVVADG